jgi:hypothetical protein
MDPHIEVEKVTNPLLLHKFKIKMTRSFKALLAVGSPLLIFHSLRLSLKETPKHLTLKLNTQTEICLEISTLLT